MAEMNETVSAGLAAYYEFTAAQLHKWADPLFERTVLAQALSLWKQRWTSCAAPGRQSQLLHRSTRCGNGLRAATAIANSPKKQPPHKDEALRALIERSRWWWPRFESRSRRWGRPYTASANRKLLTVSKFSWLCGHAYHSCWSDCVPEPRVGENLKGRENRRPRAEWARCGREVKGEWFENRRNLQRAELPVAGLSALGAIVSATLLRGWHIYVGFAFVELLCSLDLSAEPHG